MTNTDKKELRLIERAKKLITHSLTSYSALYFLLEFIRKHQDEVNVMKAIADKLKRLERMVPEEKFWQTSSIQILIDGKWVDLQFDEVLETIERIKEELPF